MHRKICAVIVTFNRLDKLQTMMKRTLEEPFEAIVVVDNASTDGTYAWLQTCSDRRLHIVKLPENIGGAGGFYEGMQYVQNNIACDWIVCYDDDAYPVVDTISRFASMEIASNVSSVAAAVYLPDGTISEMNRPRHNPFWHFQKFMALLRHGKSGYYVADAEYQSDKCIAIDASTFVGYFIRKSAIQQFGLPRKELFIYADDLIYSMQAHRQGFQHLFCPSLKFIHDCETFDKKVDVYLPMWKVYYTYRNRIEMQRLSTGIFFYPLLVMQLRKWRNQASHYPDPVLFRRLFSLALKDALRRDFSRTHHEILSFVERQKSV